MSETKTEGPLKNADPAKPATHPGSSLPNLDLRRTGYLGVLGFFILVGVLGFWAATTVIGGAVVASGQAVVPGKSQLVQSLDGGVVAEIFVKDGDLVEAGAVLLQLDPTLLEVNLGISKARLAAALAQQARLNAEQLELDTPVFSMPELPFAAPDIAAHAKRELAIFTARAEMLQGQRNQLKEALSQFDSQRAGIEGQIAAIHDQAAFLDRDLEKLRTLMADGLARQSQLSQTERARSELTGQLARLEADLARVDTARRDAKLQNRETTRAFHENVITELREVTAQVEELTLEIVTRSAQLERIEIRAPTHGIVHEMQVSTIGGVVAPGGTILEVIPRDRELTFQVRVDPRSVDQVYPGQTAQVVLSSFDPQSVPKLSGQVNSVSAGKITDPQTGQQYYRVGLDLSPEELARAGAIDLIPGMPVEAYLETGDRTVLAYLVHPISSHLRRAFRE